MLAVVNASKQKPKRSWLSYKWQASIVCIFELIGLLVLFGFMVSKIAPLASDPQIPEEKALLHNSFYWMLRCLACFVFAWILMALIALSGIGQAKGWLLIPFIGAHIAVALFMINVCIMILYLYVKSYPMETLQVWGVLGFILLFGWILLKPVMVHYVDLTLQNAKDEETVVEMRSIEKKTMFNLNL